MGAIATASLRRYRTAVPPIDCEARVALFDELRRFGFIEGQNLTIDWNGYGLQVEQFGGHAAELVKTQVDVILAGGDTAVRAAQRATAEIQILALTDDMVGQGFVRSLAKPGGNTTEVTILASELIASGRKFSSRLCPEIRRIAALAESNMAAPSRLRTLEDEARARGVELSIRSIARPEDIVPAIDGAKASTLEASSFLFNNRMIIFDRVAALRPPLSTNGRKWRIKASSGTGDQLFSFIETSEPAVG